MIYLGSEIAVKWKNMHKVILRVKNLSSHPSKSKTKQRPPKRNPPITDEPLLKATVYVSVQNNSITPSYFILVSICCLEFHLLYSVSENCPHVSRKARAIQMYYNYHYKAKLTRGTSLEETCCCLKFLGRSTDASVGVFCSMFPWETKRCIMNQINAIIKQCLKSHSQVKCLQSTELMHPRRSILLKV